jgi:hypothetical protein
MAMAGDRARVSYDPSRKWRGLVAQQGRTTLEADWNEAATIGDERDRMVTLDVVGTVGTPDGGYTVTAVPQAAAAVQTPGDLLIGAGTLYLGGERLDLDEQVTYSSQPEWLDHSTDPLWAAPAVPTATGTSYELVYLLASEQEVSAVEDPALADVALGGPDTMQRLRLLQRFVRQPSQSGACGDAWGAFVGSVGGAGLQFDPASMMLGSAATLQVSFTNLAQAPSLCQPVATGGYLGAENQMIRVMIASVDANGVPTVVWGFDDASFLYRIPPATYDLSSPNTTLTLASAPIDVYHYPAVGQTVELLRDAVQLTDTDYIASPAGFVSTVTTAYDPTVMQLVISGQPPADYLSQTLTPQLYLRVWQGTVVAPANQATPLGDTGIAITLQTSTGTFHSGDFWQFAVRPIEPAIVYPARYLAGPQPPEGPRTWACPLAVLAWDAGNPTTLHCVPPFASLVELTAMGGCCTVDVGPSDVDGGASLATLLGSYAGQGPVTICLQPGTYTLPTPLVMGPEYVGVTLQACQGDVVLQAPQGPAPGFASGLIALQGASSVTIRGIELSLPLAPFSPGSFSGLPSQNLILVEALSAGLQVALGISLGGGTGVTVEDCTFSLPDPGGSNLFGAGIYATGSVAGVTVKGCGFQSATQATVPFYDLATGNMPEPPWQLTFGYLQVPAPPSQDGTGGQQLDDATIERCAFQDVTIPALLMTGLGSLSISQNTAASCYGGFWLASLGPANFNWFDAIVVGDPTTYPWSGGQGNVPLLDRIFLFAATIGPTLPVPVVSGPLGQGTSVSLRLDVRDCQVDAVLADPNSYSGAGLLVMDIAEAIGSVVVHDSRIRTRFPAGDAALCYGLEQATVTGNIVANEFADPSAASSTNSFSLALSSTVTPFGVPAVAITGNVLIGNTVLPPRPATVSPVQDWDMLNTVIAYVLPPVVTGVTPNSGPVDAQTEVTISGSGFTGATSVHFGATPAVWQFGANPDTQITATSPAGSGTVDVTVTTPAGISATSAADQFTYAGLAPTVTGVAPNLGPAAGGSTVTISGTSFLGATAVNFGTVPAAAWQPGAIPGTQIIATSPPGSGTVDVRVTNIINESLPNPPADQFTYIPPPTVTGVSPNAGSAAGGTIVTISGSGFSGNIGVQFGTVPALAITVDSPTQITATSPRVNGGIVNVTVSNPAGTSATSNNDRFAFTPAVSGVSPNRGFLGGGLPVTITGFGFTGANRVQFGAATAAWQFVSDTQINATSPPSGGFGTVNVSVTTPTGVSPGTGADLFTYVKIKDKDKEKEGKEQVAAEKITDRPQVALDAPEEGLPAGSRDAFIEPGERPEVGRALQDDDSGTSPGQEE